MLEDNYSDIEKAVARNKSYVGPAVLTFFLYLLFWIPGLIVNLIYFIDARKKAKIIGAKPSGYGCLIALFIWAIFPLVAVILLIVALLSPSAIAPFIYPVF